jgi:hypothetical protein
MRKRVVAATIVAGVALAGCSSGSPAPSTSSVPSSTPGPSISQVTGTSTSLPTSATSSVGADCADASSCARALYDAWARGDRAGAARGASAAAVAQIFSHPYGQLPTNQGPVGPYQSGPICAGTSPVTCTWIGQDQRLTMTVTPGGGGFRVTNVLRSGG